MTPEGAPPGCPFPSLSDEAARRLLESILRLRRAAAHNSDIAISIPRMTRELSEGIAGWAIHQLADTASKADFAGLSVERRRGAVATHAQYGLLPPGSDAELVETMLALNGGQITPLVKRSPSSRRDDGRSWDVARRKLRLLTYWRWRCGQGHREGGAALTAVAKKVGVTPQAVRKWEGALRDDPYPGNWVRDWLRKAEAAGREAKANGSAFPGDPMDVTAAELKSLLWPARKNPNQEPNGRLR